MSEFTITNLLDDIEDSANAPVPAGAPAARSQIGSDQVGAGRFWTE